MLIRKDKKTDNIDDICAAKIDHGMTTVLMTAEAGGHIGGIQHAALGDSEGSWFIALEVSLRTEVEEELLRDDNSEGKQEEDGGGDEEKKEDWRTV